MNNDLCGCLSDHCEQTYGSDAPQMGGSNQAIRIPGILQRPIVDAFQAIQETRDQQQYKVVLGM